MKSFKDFCEDKNSNSQEIKKQTIKKDIKNKIIIHPKEKVTKLSNVSVS